MEVEALALQDDELTALDSIYPNLLVVNKRDVVHRSHVVTLTIPISLPLPTATHLSSPSHVLPVLGPPPSAPELALRLSHLPPVSARVALPAGYPLTEPPRVLSLRAPLPQARTEGPPTGGWISRRILAHVQERLAVLWKDEAIGGEGIGVLWSWWEWIGSGSFLEDLGLIVDHVLTLPTPIGVPASTFQLLLKSNDAAITRADFEGTAFPCAICFENRKGKQSVQLPKCGCIFCFSCLNSFWNLAIQEGTLENVACPSIGCVKMRATGDAQLDHAAGAYAEERSDGISSEVVASVVGPEMQERWQMLSEKRLVDTNPDYTFCPRKACQAAVPPDKTPVAAAAPAPPKAKIIRLDIRRPNADNDNARSGNAAGFGAAAPGAPAAADANAKWDNCRTCPRCNYTFCLVCRGVWHGVHTPCQFSDVAAVVKEYLDGDDDVRRNMEARLGVKGTEALHALIREHEREAMFKQWVSDNAAICPKCEASIQKSEGCNHMKCPFCSVHFCYRCGQKISDRDPYMHFREEKSACYGKLFDYDPGDDGGWIPMEVFDF